MKGQGERVKQDKKAEKESNKEGMDETKRQGHRAKVISNGNGHWKRNVQRGRVKYKAIG